MQTGQTEIIGQFEGQSFGKRVLAKIISLQ
jgi:hypothetical protein